MSPRIFFLLLFFALLTVSHTFSQEPLSPCENARQAAAKDAFKNQLKYYFYGIVGPNQEVIQQIEKLGVRPVVRGCIHSEADDCYNQLADSIVYVRSGVRISALK